MKNKLLNPWKGSLDSEHYHYEVGRQLHANIYYFDKYYFQSSANAELVGSLIADRLLLSPFDIDEITLIGVGIFSSTYLSRAVYLVQEARPGRKMNWGTVNNMMQELSFIIEPVFYRNVVIILPLTYTFARCFELERLLITHTKEFTRFRGDTGLLHIIREYIAVFLVADSHLEIETLNEGEIQFIPDISIERMDVRRSKQGRTAEMYSTFGWSRVYRQQISFIDRSPYDGRSATFLQALPVELSSGEHCPYCFPENAYDEKILLPVRGHYDSPNLIFNLPQFANTDGNIGETDFDKVFSIHRNPGHLFGHLDIEGNSFLHYIQRHRFYENNKSAILLFFSRALNKLFPSLAISAEHVLVISPTNRKGATILDDLLKDNILPRSRTTIIYTDPSTEFLENFLSNSSSKLEAFAYVLFFDYVISKGNTFRQINDYLQHVRGEARGFDAVMVITDRSTAYSKQAILRRIYQGAHITNGLDTNYDRFIAYFKLNVPLLDAHSSGNPIVEKNLRFREIFDYCQLDAVKQIVRYEIDKGKPLDLPSLTQKNSSYPRQIRARYLMKLHIAHQSSIWLDNYIRHFNDTTDRRAIPFELGDLRRLIHDVTRLIQGGEHTEFTRSLEQAVIETFTESPYKYYKAIYLTSFEFIKDKLITMVTDLRNRKWRIRDHLETEDFGFYLERSVEVNSNFILSDVFLQCLQGVFENPENLNKPYTPDLNALCQLYKMLIFRQPYRAIRLEEILNAPSLLSLPIRDQFISVERALEDRYYMLVRLLKAENNFILHQLTNLFLQHLKDGLVPTDNTDDLAQVRNFITDTYLAKTFDRTNRVIGNFQDLAQLSKDSNTEGEDVNKITLLPKDLCEAAMSMLLTVYRIEKDKEEDDPYITNASSILSEASKIVGNDLRFAFCIEYRERDPQTTISANEPVAENIYTIISDDKDRHNNIHKEGLIYEMLHGLSEKEDRGLQTFLAIVKLNDGAYSAFQSTYFSADYRYNNEGKEVWIDKAIRQDLRTADRGVIDPEATMILLFRLADIELDLGYNHSGQAVLAISANTAVTTERLIAFLNIERIRMLLVIKQNLRAYLKTQFENDAFISLVNDQKKLEYKAVMQHMLDNYFLALDSLWEKGKTITDNNVHILNFILNKIRRHVLSIGEEPGEELELLGDLSYEKTTYDQSQVVELFELVMTIPRLARMALKDQRDRTQEIEIPGKFWCEPVIFEQVITEVIINMRRYGIESKDDPVHFKIYLRNDVLYFENPYNPLFNNNPHKQEKGHGKDMCNKILEKYNYWPLNEKILSGDRFQIALNLKPKTLSR